MLLKLRRTQVNYKPLERSLFHSRPGFVQIFSKELTVIEDPPPPQNGSRIRHAGTGATGMTWKTGIRGAHSCEPLKRKSSDFLGKPFVFKEQPRFSVQLGNLE